MTNTVRALSKRLWPKKHNVGLAQYLNVPMVTARSWNNGTRRMPEHRLLQLEALVREDILVLGSFADQLHHQAKIEARRFKPRSGFWQIKDWHGTGFEHDMRHRWGQR
jgi:hypothetical protein